MVLGTNANGIWCVAGEVADVAQWHLLAMTQKYKDSSRSMDKRPRQGRQYDDTVFCSTAKGKSESRIISLRDQGLRPGNQTERVETSQKG